MATKYKLEYVWLDGKQPIPELRGKTQLKTFENPPTLADIPKWGFDGSSTMQAEGSKSDCVLKPVSLYPDASRNNGYIVLCEVMHPDGTPNSTNMRATIDNDPDLWVGFEQEYFLYKDGRPLGFPKDGFPPPQGPFYCGVGYKYVGSIARQIVEEHLELCLTAGINHEGINAEVAKGQWEFQIFGKGSKNAADQMWVARYILMRLCESYGVDVNWHCKPLGKDVEPKAHLHPGAEFLYVMDGELELRHGDQVCTLEAGDAVYFDASTPHSYQCAGKKPAAVDNLPVCAERTVQRRPCQAGGRHEA